MTPTTSLFWNRRGLSSLLLLTVVAGGCSPETVGTTCQGDGDCFSNERCISSVCVARPTDTVNTAPDDGLPGPDDAGADEGVVDTSLIDDASLDSDEATGDDLPFDLVLEASSDTAETDTANTPDVFDSTDAPDLAPATPALLAYWRLDGYIGEERECLETLHGRIDVVNGAFPNAAATTGDGGADMGNTDMGDDADTGGDIVEPEDEFGALSFNGFSHITTGFELDLDADSDLSILAWFKTSSDAAQVIMGFGSPGEPRLQLLVSERTVEVTLEDDLGAVSTAVSFAEDPPARPSPVTDGEWHQIAIVRDTSARSLILYLDGRLAAEADDDTGVLSGADQPLLLGGTGGAGGLGGTLDDVVVIGGALSASDLGEYLASGAPWLDPILTCEEGRMVASLPLMIDFEDVAYGCFPTPWRRNPAATHRFVGVVADGCDRLLAHRTDRADTPAPRPTVIFSPTSEDLIVEVALRPQTPADAYRPSAIFSLTAVSGAFATLGIYIGTFFYEDAGVDQRSGVAVPERWYRFRAELDVDQNTYNAFVDDEVYGYGGAFASGTADSISSIAFWAEQFDIDDLSIRLANNSALGGACEFDFDCGGEPGLECVNHRCYESEIVDNEGFGDGLTGWDDVSNACADGATVELLPDLGDRGDVLHLDSRSIPDCDVTVGQWIDVSKYELSELGVEYTWRVDAIEERSGQVEFVVDFVERGFSRPAYSFRHIRGGLDDDPCAGRLECIHDTSYDLGSWTVNYRFFENLSFLPQSDLDRLRIQLLSRSIDGQGADAYFDEIRLYVVPQ